MEVGRPRAGRRKCEDLGIPPAEFGLRVRKWRTEIMGWSQERLARELGLTAQTISRWELGKRLPDTDGVIRGLVQLRFS